MKIPAYFRSEYAPSEVPLLARLRNTAERLHRLGLAELRSAQPVQPDALVGLHEPAYLQAFLQGDEPMASRQGIPWSPAMRDATLAIYRYAAEFAAERGILIADTKLEFGLDENDQLIVMDEMLTPDSSRFWPADEYQVGISPPSYDKQFVRDYLETLDWNKTAPGPGVPADVIAGTAAKYAEALRRLAGIVLD